MPSELIDRDGPHPFEVARETLAELRARDGFYWIDIHGPTPAEIDLLGEVYGFHPLALEDAKQFGQRPRLDSYDRYVFTILYGAVPDADDLVEVHAFYAAGYLVTLHHDECPGFDAARERLEHSQYDLEHPIALVYRVVEGLVDSFFPILETINDEIDTLGDAIVERPTDEQLHAILRAKRRLVALRRVISPMRDLFASISAGAVELPGMTESTERYFRDIYDHLIRLTDAGDSYRDLMTATMDAYQSTVSNRLNVVMKRLTVISTIFLPLSFITGFFGQNFGWMVEEIGGVASFVGLGVGLQLLALVVLLALFKKRGWF